jgi:predicted aspartyl protease
MSIRRFSPWADLPFTAFFLAVLAGTSAPASSAAGQTAAAHPLPGYEIIRLGQGHYNRLDFVAKIDGVKGLLFVDTGASQTVLSAEKYDFLLKNGAKRPPNVPATVPVNGMSAPVAIATDVELGSVRRANLPFPLVHRQYLFDSLARLGYDRQYDGFFGENFLRAYNAIVDCGRLALYLNTDPRQKLDPGKALIANGWTQVPMANVGSHFAVSCTLAGHLVRLLVDTGAPFTVFDSSAMRAARIEQQELNVRSGVIGYIPSTEYAIKATTLQIGSYVASNLHLLSNARLKEPLAMAKVPAGEEPPVGLLGGNTLCDNGALIDIGNHFLYLKHTGPPTSVQQ